MTLHISAVIRGAAYQVSDRRASFRDGRVWEPECNKNIVLRTPDALVSIGFSSRTYIGPTPIDEWAADVIWGEKIDAKAMLAMRTRDRLDGLSSVLRRLQTALNTHFSESVIAPEPSRVHLAVVGWRFRRRGLAPCLLTLSNLSTGRKVNTHDRLNTRQRFGFVQVDPPGWVPVARLHELNEALAQGLTCEERENLMIDLLRERSREGKPIGPDAMCIRIPYSEAKPTIRFEPAATPARVFTREDDGLSQIMSVAYTPTIITPRLVQLPSLTTGLPFENLAGFRVDWKLPRMGPPSFDGTLLWLNDRQPRRPNR